MDSLNSKLEQIWNHAAERGPDVLVTIIVGLIVVEVLIAIIGSALRASRLPDGLKRILFSLIRLFLWVILFLVILQTLGLNNVLVAVTGSSVIVALFLSAGVAPIITDVLAGLTMASDQGFQPGAKVRVGEKQTEGTVVSMDLRKTRIRDTKGITHVIPNAEIDKREWVILKPKSSGLPRRGLRATLKRKKR